MKKHATSIANTLFAGDNLTILREYFPSASVDLIYLDPPFNSKRDYNLIYENAEGKAPRAQIEAFEDTWRWTIETDNLYKSLIESGEINPVCRETLKAFKSFLREDSLMAYLTMMLPRLIEFHRVLKPTGSIYLHCDQSASHYLKIIMDQIFGRDNFLNNIVWCYGLGGSSPRRWPRKHDDILWYSREVGKQTFSASMIPATSQRMKGKLKKSPDHWNIPAINNMAKERVGYPTQKPLALLERIVESSSLPGALVLDPFCGGGTTLVAAEKLGRRWAGIDITYLSIATVEKRLLEQFPDIEIKSVGSPTTVEEARELYTKSEMKFASWILSLFGAKQITEKGNANCLHGEHEFRGAEDSIQRIYIGIVKDDDIDVITRKAEEALSEFQIAFFVSLEDVPDDFRQLEKQFDFFQISEYFEAVPRVQFSSVGDLLRGDFPQLPEECRGQMEKIFRIRNRGKTRRMRGI